MIVDLNVGGVAYSASLELMLKLPESKFSKWFDGGTPNEISKDTQGRYFIDRDGQLFRYILDYLRNDQLILPEKFGERNRLLNEAKFYNIRGLICELGGTVNDESDAETTNALSKMALKYNRTGHITLGYQGTFSFGKQQGMGLDVSFRKINRILVCGRVSLCREVFGESLHEGRDPDRGHDDRYTSRYYLKHSCLEQAFDQLAAASFKLISSTASGTSGGSNDAKPGSSTEEDRWAHYNEFIFYRFT